MHAATTQLERELQGDPEVILDLEEQLQHLRDELAATQLQLQQQQQGAGCGPAGVASSFQRRTSYGSPNACSGSQELSPVGALRVHSNASGDSGRVGGWGGGGSVTAASGDNSREVCVAGGGGTTTGAGSHRSVCVCACVHFGGWGMGWRGGCVCNH